ncbi:MAG TPA: RNA-binding domain-containing protein [Candidatus Nanoarchaeia archaeon]|nr:RNA-binding domain-containing protein [Candidatus Nanoarchaeia archaeon]
MKIAHFVKLSVFSYEGEDSETILGSLLKLIPFDLEKNNIPVSKSAATGFNEKKIHIFEIMLQKNSLIKEFLDFLKNSLGSEQRNIISCQAASRLDELLDFFIRLDKKEWIENSKMILTDSGKCFHIKISIAAFPKKREVGLKMIKELFE